MSFRVTFSPASVICALIALLSGNNTIGERRIRMASKTIVVDDLDGSEGAQTIQFSIQGSEYEVDLTDSNVARLHEALEPYVKVARKVGVGGRIRRAVGTDKSSVDLKALRAWAASNDIDVPKRGRIPQSIVDKFHAAGN